MRKTQGRRPLIGAAPNTHVAIDSSNTRNIPDPGTGPQPSALRSFWAEAGRFVRCSIIRRSDRPWWLTALAAGDETASAFRRALRDWMAHALEHRPICLSCEVTFFTTLGADRLGNAQSTLAPSGNSNAFRHL
jgi:hypothetical protein